MKEIRLTTNIAQNDFDTKLKKAINFLKEGNQVKISLTFKGREIVLKDRGELTMLRFSDKLSEHGRIQNMPKLIGKKMSITVNPKKK